MPLFGKSKKKEYEAAKSAYPTQQAYPQQAQGPPPPPMYAQPPAVNPQWQQQGPPPPYSTQPGYQGYVQQPYGQPQGAPQYQQQQYPQYGYPAPQQQYQPQTVMVPGGFDAGARFGAGPVNIPPPPPGCAPNAAQMAVSQGQNVVVTQRPTDFMTGGSDGGYVVW